MKPDHTGTPPPPEALQASMRLPGADEYDAMVTALAQPVTPIPALAAMTQESRLYTTSSTRSISQRT